MTGRENLRVEYNIKAYLKHDDTTVEGNVKNLSMQGIFFQTTESLPLDSEVELTLELTAESSKMSLDINGNIMRKEDNGAAISFINVDINSFIVLRNIVAHRAFDEDKIIKEFEDTYPGDDV